MTFDGSFDIAIAPVAPASRGYFLGDYEGLTSAGSTFLALYVVTNPYPTGGRTNTVFQRVDP